MDCDIDCECSWTGSVNHYIDLVKPSIRWTADGGEEIRIMMKKTPCRQPLLCCIFDTLITIISKPLSIDTIITMARVFTPLTYSSSYNDHISLLVTKAKVALEQFTNYFLQTGKN